MHAEMDGGQVLLPDVAGLELLDAPIDHTPRPARAIVRAAPRWRQGDLVADRYLLDRRIGRGGMGEVWLARHTTLNFVCAIKFLRPDVGGTPRMEVLERFQFEAQVSAQLAPLSPHIVRVVDAGEFQEMPYLVMDHVSGGTLEEWLARHGKVPPRIFANLLEQLARALEAAHGHGILHRDLKPSNILLEEGRDGRFGAAKLTDFGVAKATRTQPELVRPKDTAVGIMVGSPHYIAPETAFGDGPVDHRSDLWCLGVVTFEALTGQRPFGTVFSLSNGEQPLLPPMARVGLPRGLDAWFRRALAIEPSERFDSAREMADAFRAALASSRRPRAGWIALAVASAAVVGAVQFASRGESPVLRLHAPMAAVVSRASASAAEAAAPTVTVVADEPAPTPPAKSAPRRRRRQVDPSEIQ